LIPHSKDNIADTRFLTWFFIILVILSLVVYRDIFTVKPSGDDFTPPLAEIHRGQVDGPLAFFKSSQLGNYRPLDSLLMWAFGSISQKHVLFWIHILHILSFWFFTLVVFMWINLLKLNKVGAVVTALIVFFHPVIAGPVASIDGSSRILVSAFVWLGVFFIMKYSNRSFFAASLACVLAFIIALGFMEYAIQLVPLAFIAVIFCAQKSKLLKTIALIVVLGIVLMAYLLLRGLIVGQGISFFRFVTPNPADWIKNAALIYSAVLFLGNTVWVKVAGNISAYAWFLFNIILVVIALSIGAFIYQKEILKISNRIETENMKSGYLHDKLKLPFLFLSFLFSCFPMIFVRDLSELYLSGVIVPLALISGFAADGWSRMPRRYPAIAVLLLIFEIAIAIQAIESKVDDLKIAGGRTHALAKEILKYIPEDASGWKIGFVFLKSEIDMSDSYSIFRMPDIYLIYPTLGMFAMDWYRPGKNHNLIYLVVSDISQLENSDYNAVFQWETQTEPKKEDFDLILRWNYQTKKSELIQLLHDCD